MDNNMHTTSSWSTLASTTQPVQQLCIEYLPVVSIYILYYAYYEQSSTAGSMICIIFIRLYAYSSFQYYFLLHHNIHSRVVCVVYQVMCLLGIMLLEYAYYLLQPCIRLNKDIAVIRPFEYILSVRESEPMPPLLLKRKQSTDAEQIVPYNLVTRSSLNLLLSVIRNQY